MLAVTSSVCRCLRQIVTAAAAVCLQHQDVCPSLCGGSSMAHAITSRLLLSTAGPSRLLLRSPCLKLPANQVKITRSTANLPVTGMWTKKRLMMMGVGIFAGTALATRYYEEWKRAKVHQQLIHSQVYFDSEKRELIKTASNGSPLIQQLSPELLDKVRGMNVARSVVGSTPLFGVKLTLFQYATCPFCCKVRTLLDYYGLSYDVIEVDPVLRQQLKIFEGKRKKVPILVMSRESEGKATSEKETIFIDEPLKVSDSSLIISLIASFFTCNPDLQDNVNQLAQMYPSVTFASLEEDKAIDDVVNKYFLMKGDHMDESEYKRVIKGLSEERKWREWADNHLVHMLSPNVYRTLDEALYTFDVFSNVGQWALHFPSWEVTLVKYVGAFAMWLVSKRLKKRHGLKEDVRESLYDATHVWLTHVRKNAADRDHFFAGGKKPNLADLAVYGVYHSIEGTDAFAELLMHPTMSARFKRWYVGVKQQVMMKRGSPELAQMMRARHKAVAQAEAAAATTAAAVASA